MSLYSYLPGSIVLDFTGRLEVCVKRAGESQSAVARQLGVTRSTVSQWTHGLTEPTPANCVRLARLARVRIEWLVLGEEPMETASISPELLASLLDALKDADDSEIREVIRFAGYKPEFPPGR